MANIEFKDIVEERNAGDAAPVGTEIFGVQTNPDDPDVADRPYQRWSWLYIVEQVKAAIGNATTSVSGLLSASDKTKLDNQSGTNTGDETTATIKTKLGAASNVSDGYLLSSDWSLFDNKQDALGFTPENAVNKNATNGYVGLTSGVMDGDQLPAMSTTKKGGVPATGTPSGKFLKDDGTWDTVAGGSFTQSSQAQAEASASNTAIGTPTALDTTTGITPNRLWYFFQKAKEYILEAFGVLTYGATVTWSAPKSFNQAKLTATGNFTFDITDTKDGSSGLIKIIVNTTSAITVTFDTSFTNKIVTTTALNYTFPAGVANREYWFQYALDGTVMTWFVSDDKVEFPVYTGEITTTSIGGATINNNAVTHAKYQNIANGTMLGNNSGSSGVPQELAGVSYDTIPPKVPYAIKSANYTLVRAVDYEIEVTATSTQTLPASPQAGDTFVIRNNGAAITVTIGGTVNGVASPTITTRYQAVRVIYNGTSWMGNTLAV